MLMLTQVVSFKPREGHKEESASNILNISQFHRKRKTFFCKKNTPRKNSNNNIDMKYAQCLSMQNMSVLAASVGVQQTYRPLHCGASTVVARSAKGRRSLRRATRTSFSPGENETWESNGSTKKRGTHCRKKNILLLVTRAQE
jgi:hypothetical protein